MYTEYNVEKPILMQICRTIDDRLRKLGFSLGQRVVEDSEGGAGGDGLKPHPLLGLNGMMNGIPPRIDIPKLLSERENNLSPELRLALQLTQQKQLSHSMYQTPTLTR